MHVQFNKSKMTKQHGMGNNATQISGSTHIADVAVMATCAMMANSPA